MAAATLSDLMRMRSIRFSGSGAELNLTEQGDLDEGCRVRVSDDLAGYSM